MKTHYIYRYLLLSIIFVLGGCDAENFKEQQCNLYQNHEIEVRVSLADFIHNDMNSRASTEDNSILSDVKNLNIRINTNETSKYFYCDVQTGKISPLESEENKVIETQNGTQIALLHFYLSDIANISSVEVLGNFDEPISDDVSWNSAVKSNKNIANPNPTSIESNTTEWKNFLSTNRCLLYGKTKGKATRVHSDLCDLYNVQLKRPYAMIKVNVKNLGLNSGIEITPQSVQLLNVPNTFDFTSNQGVSEFDKYSRKGQVYNYPKALHPLKNGENTIVTADRLYMLENKQNKNVEACITEPNTEGQLSKSPNKLVSSDPIQQALEVNNAYLDSQNINGTKPNLGRRCTFVLLKAKYSYKNVVNKNNIAYSGTINYRIFLGENIDFDFDVNRNMIYNLTLGLSGNGGITEAGVEFDENSGKIKNFDVSGSDTFAQWRVDIDLSDFFIDFSATDFNVDGHVFKTTVFNNNPNTSVEISVLDNTKSWIKIYNEQAQTWQTPGDYSGTYGTPEGQEILLFLKGYGESGTGYDEWSKKWNDAEPYRSTQLFVTKYEIKNGKKTEIQKKTYTLKQWYPVKIQESPVLYIDRIDRYAYEGGVQWDHANQDPSQNYTFTNLDISKQKGPDIMRHYRNTRYLRPYPTNEWDKIIPQHITDFIYRSAVASAIHDSFNASGSTEVQELDEDGSPYYANIPNLYFYYHYLPTIKEWEIAHKVLSEKKIGNENIKNVVYNKYEYWTINHDDNSTAYVFNPNSVKGEKRPRTELHCFKLIFDPSFLGI